MEDVFFNELSIDNTFVNLPSTKDDAKKVFCHFVKSCISYILSKGVDKNLVMQIHDSIGLFSSLILYDTYEIKELLLELYNEDLITEIEKLKFQMFVNDSFSKSWSGDYQFNNREVFGIGKAKEEGSYVISFKTNFISGSSDWSHSQYRISKMNDNGTIEFDFERNIATPKHVFQKYKIWKKCKFKNSRPTSELIPNIGLSEVIVLAYSFTTWTSFYDEINQMSKTTIKEISKIIAAVNGWNESSECPKQKRLLFKCKGYYLATDTQHATFEVYSSKGEHEGEIYFNSNKINIKKKDTKRGICGRKTDK